MDPLQRLQLMLDDMEQVDDLYRPTQFWGAALGDLTREIQQRGFADFRAHRSARKMYVPIYASGAYQKNRRTIERAAAAMRFVTRSDRLADLFLNDHSGMRAAEREWAMFRAGDPTDRAPALHELSESAFGAPIEHFTFQGRRYSRSFLHYLMGLVYLKKTVDTSELRSVLEIGGGFGTVGEILHGARDDAFYADVDIPPVAAISTWYLEQVLGEDRVLGYEQTRELERIDLDEIARSHRAAVLCPWQLPRVTGSVDLFMNFVSFQEMEPRVVRNYIEHVQPLTRRWVLLRNSRTGKPLAAGAEDMGVLEPTTTDDMVKAFDAFEERARDAAIFGRENPKTGFRSEVIVLERRG